MGVKAMASKEKIDVFCVYLCMKRMKFLVFKGVKNKSVVGLNPIGFDTLKEAEDFIKHNSV